MDSMFSSSDILFDLPRWYFIAIIVVGFITYYFMEAVKHPILVCAEGKFKNFLLANLPVLQEKYWPTLWCFESRIHTFLASILRSLFPNVKYRREILQMKDGGHIALDWYDENCPSEAPIIIILPGLTGESQSEYIRCLVNAANCNKYRTAVLNYRGLGGIPLKTSKVYNAESVDDITEVVHHIRSLNPGVPLAATGISMGTLLLGNYIASQQHMPEKTLLAAMMISPPWNVFKAMESLEKPYLNLMLNRYLANGFLRLMDRWKRQKMLHGPFDLEEVMKSKTVREFDARYTVKKFGFRDTDDYYSRISIHDKLHMIEVPLLCLSAADDPVQPVDAIPVEEIKKNENIAVMITARGGHIGFMEGFLPVLQEQYMCRVFVQYFRAIFSSGAELLSTIKNEQ